MGFTGFSGPLGPGKTHADTSSVAHMRPEHPRESQTCYCSISRGLTSLILLRSSRGAAEDAHAI
ncbi:hypothetical protein DPMN_086934 [Dreissena polymorpha]|uniref:Uncharacterized protein n=1 Tax=Dreissena polymorpha TaxID=45954 RepID=A0A9D4KS24_DREPO|nr:hypothetical protein DPMN_086934 [Dreissena polymorpha]